MTDMATEIERKFLTIGEGWRSSEAVTSIRQGYLVAEKERSVRVRIRGDEAWITVKGGGAGISRSEFEFPIPVEEACEMLDTLCLPEQIDKHRYLVSLGDHTWEVDEFHGANEGLVIAEIELSSEDESFDRPDWLGEEVSDDPRYFNARLIREPFTRWV